MNLDALKKVPDITGWLRAPQADKFMALLERGNAAVLADLIGACSVSQDPKVRALQSLYHSNQETINFLRATRKESAGEDE